MKNRCLYSVVTVVGMAWVSGVAFMATPAAMAQTPAARGPGTAASAPPLARPAPRPLTPTELRNSATSPDDQPPEGPVLPQINIPFGKTPPPPKHPPRQLPAAAASSAVGISGIGDSAARCDAQEDALARAACRNKLTGDSRKR